MDGTDQIDATTVAGTIQLIAEPRVGVIGTGYWGQNLVRNFHELHALAAVCDSDQGRLGAMLGALIRGLKGQSRQSG